MSSAVSSSGKGSDLAGEIFSRSKRVQTNGASGALGKLKQRRPGALTKDDLRRGTVVEKPAPAVSSIYPQLMTW